MSWRSWFLEVEGVGVETVEGEEGEAEEGVVIINIVINSSIMDSRGGIRRRPREGREKLVRWK
jgi:hypothetical protein